ILRRREWPEYWPPGAKKITWPEAPKESLYRKSMSPKDYWDALCRTEAGEFIYKNTKNVDGFFLVRPSGAETDDALRDKFVVEDAYGALEFYSTEREKRPGLFFIDRSVHSYRYVEAMLTVSSEKARPIRHEADLAKLVELLKN